eukprot:TRINITY_DN1020_c0_g1_i1.p1 TRINITY_DN1020_c0_g1~~TRINITY_DN1020_c0_g1_i1.p1  ORF type:complete len:261 (+),score=25.64 TRINITY_DN1020_c0_g1_i1:771-1553(+)
MFLPLIKGKPLYVRPCYPKLYREIVQSWLQGNIQSTSRWSLCGNPGIGKSCFGYYCLWRLAQGKDNINILYDNALVNYVVRFQNSAVHIYKRGELIGVGHRTIYICDGQAPNYGSSPKNLTLLITSPNPRHSKEFLKNPSQQRWMPVWTLEELSHIADPAEIDDAFQIWGGIPRSIFRGNISDLEAINLIRDDPLQIIQQVSKGLMDHDSTSHKLVHIIPRDDFASYSCAFASVEVSHRIVNKLSVDNKAKFLLIVSSRN